ncbi:Flp pilus assembly protein CpaB, partial [Achromobacter sp. GG226]|uniref:Flp pilus assembly protein CpaB n=1 Tax=Verticiella alkaliphila TaxID=2779529 RepID=UPI001C0CE2EB
MNTATKLFAILLFLLAVILGVFAFLLARQPAPAPAPVVVAPTAPRESAPPPVPTVRVVVAARPVEAGRVIGAEDVRLADWGAMPGGGFGQTADVIGRVTRFALSESEAVTQTELASGLALRLEAGERAVAIAVDPVLGVAHQVQPGDWVDVFFTLPRAGADVQRNQARLLLSRVRVLAYGDQSVDGATTREGRGNAPSAATAVLAVPIAEVNDLLLARGNGVLQLALRSPLDETTPAVALFPSSTPVLSGRTGLTAAEREQLASPENRAYAGLDLPALAGPLPTPPAP